MNKIKYTFNFFKMKKRHKIIFFKKFLIKYNFFVFLTLLDKINKKKKINYTFVNNLIDINSLDMDKVDRKLADYLWNQYSNHNFNLLGSGWLNANKNDSFKNINNQDKSYQEIAWNKDLKNNYTFENLYSYRIVNIPSNVDIKFPWELSRMYHLPQMAILSRKIKNKQPEIINEFKNQIKDFDQNNPIGFGVNWKSTMDVAIRSVNILISYDLFRSQDTNRILNDQFEKNIVRMMIYHGRFIYSNLELNFLNQKSGNHYLSNLCALLFISSYISNDETKKWYEFSKKEVIREFDEQFFKDGSNYECSTAYHRLSSELIFYSFGILINNNEKLNENIIHKLSQISVFSNMYTYENLVFSQIGDNDSGRLLKIFPEGDFYSVKDYKEKYFSKDNTLLINESNNVFVENELSSNILFIASHVFGFENDEKIIRNVRKVVEFDFFSEFIKKKIITKDFKENTVLKGITKEQYLLEENKSLFYDKTAEFQSKHKIIFNRATNIVNKSKIEFSSNFGLIKVLNDNFVLLIRVVPDVNKMLKAHLHDDFLNFEIFYKGKSYFQDPGSYVYTESKEQRNYFRSSKAHNVPEYESDFNDFINVFNVNSTVRGEILKLTKEEIKIRMIFKGITHERTFYLSGNELIVVDESTHPFKFELNDRKVYSEGYGKLINSGFNTKNTDVSVEKIK
ncbi:hypothetical protein A0126_12820 [Exiguobacterium sp. N4-1P]|uniref:heparinase II/III domain-containing protein n=1 Tax=Exiguobacterium sp. N4-1P TaxID=2051906 RepID=UPI000B597513|nr:heparinase II/III family protein [Exiguobacterium sp. N4-1P]ASI36429.1 hypothetical protein A0126_12820 [Exiguobacterium sp. N4-1P]